MTYWDSKGKYQELAEAAESLIPMEGSCDNDAPLELVRVVFNLYHDYCNNGWEECVVNTHILIDFLDSKIEKAIDSPPDGIPDDTIAAARSLYSRIHFAVVWSKDDDRMFVKGSESEIDNDLEGMIDFVLLNWDKSRSQSGN